MILALRILSLPGHLRWRVQLSSCAQSAAAAAALTAANTATQLSTSRMLGRGATTFRWSFQNTQSTLTMILKNLFNMLSPLEIGKIVRKVNY